MSEFDQEAAGYDALFSYTKVGLAQRAQVYQQLEKEELFTGQKVLELNCGTGIDAAEFLKRGNSILATDASAAMLQETAKKVPQDHLKQLRMENLSSNEGSYSLIFSNFGGLNCVAREQISTFFGEAAQLLEPDGKLVLVVMGKKCLWDRFYLLLKGRRKEMHRRNTNVGIEVPVANGSVTTWYYSPDELIQLAAPALALCTQKPIGLFVPPSYLSGFYERKKIALGTLKFLDRFLRFSGLANFSDHYYLSLRKK